MSCKYYALAALNSPYPQAPIVASVIKFRWKSVEGKRDLRRLLNVEAVPQAYSLLVNRWGKGQIGCVMSRTGRCAEGGLDEANTLVVRHVDIVFGLPDVRQERACK